MSWSLKLQNGDLAIGAGQFQTISQDSKLVQDFRNFLLTELGSDPLYPWYGSTIDGSESVQSPIATTDWAFAKVQIESEIRRVGAQYQRLQFERAKADRIKYNKSTLTAAEILAAITRIDFKQKADTLTVKIFFVTATDQGNLIEVTLPPVYSR